MSQEVQKLNRTFSLEVNGKAREVFMSMGLLNELCKLIGDVENIGNVVVDDALREGVMVSLLAERSKSGKISQKFDIDELDVDPDQVIALVGWATEWVVDFFMKSAEAAKRVMVKNQERLNSLMSSPAGTKD